MTPPVVNDLAEFASLSVMMLWLRHCDLQSSPFQLLHLLLLVFCRGVIGPELSAELHFVCCFQFHTVSILNIADINRVSILWTF